MDSSRVLFLTVFGICNFGEASVIDLDVLKNPIQLMIDSINRYIRDEEKRIDHLARLSTRLNHSKTGGLISDRDVLSQYLITKYLVNIGSLIHEAHDIQKYATVSDEDCANAAIALFRLQDTYALDVKSIANGKLIDSDQSENLVMTASDCFELGQVAMDQEPPDYYHALLWLQESLDRLQHENSDILEESEILLPLSKALYQQNNLERAFLAATRLKTLDPHSSHVDENLNFYTAKLNADNSADIRVPPIRLNRPLDARFPDLEIYEKACRGQLKPLEKRILVCNYKRNNGYSKLAPLKAERLHWDPEIIVFRNGISKTEAESIKRLAIRKLERSVISTTVNMDVAKYRTSKTAWLSDRDDSVVMTISKRVQEMAGLTVTSAESLQVANYELGGHYMPHFDYAGDEKNHQFANLGTGDRIATILFYLSNTKAGGATVFPTLQLTVYPQEHDALFWYNLRRNGNGDTRTRHAACPVLIGTKWIANKWVHEYGQEFLRPCGLSEDE